MATKKWTQKKLRYGITSGPDYREALRRASNFEPLVYGWDGRKEIEGMRERFALFECTHALPHPMVLLRLARVVVFRNVLGKRVVNFAWVHFTHSGAPDYWVEADETDLIEYEH